MKQHQNQSGALLLEVLAVLGLVGMMAPFLYRQALERNREVSNVAIASEMRTVIEALRTALEVDFDPNITCPNLTDQNTNTTTECVPPPDISFYLPAPASNYIAADSYDIKVYCRNTLCICGNGGDGQTCDAGDDCDRGGTPTYVEPVCYGLIMSQADNLPQNLTLRRARRIASLIGSSGGVCQADLDSNAKVALGQHIEGTLGAWRTTHSVNNDLNCALDTTTGYGLAANTGIITTLVGSEEAGQALTESTVAIPPNVAFENLHAYGYFSVGTGGNNCYSLNRNNGSNEFENSSGDTIYHVGNGPNNCDPLFWVGTKDTSNGSNDHSAAGQVYVKNNLYIGRDNAGEKQAISLEKDESANNNVGGRIIVHNADGTGTVTIRGDGSMELGKRDRDNFVAGQLTVWGRDETGDEEEKNITISGNTSGNDPFIQVNRNDDIGIEITPEGLRDKDETDYKVDPAYTSRMMDIEIGARGNARLSQILPNYILKNVTTLTGANSYTIEAPLTTDTPSVANRLTCPHNYNRTLVIVPVTGTTVELPEDTTITKASTVTGEDTIPALNAAADITLIHKYPAVKIDSDYENKKSSAGGSSNQQAHNTWTVTLGYCPSETNCNGNDFVPDSSQKALAYIYCVYSDTHDIDNGVSLNRTNPQPQNP